MHKFKVHLNDRFPEAQGADHYISLTEGELDGICFNFGKIEFVGEDEEGFGKISFDYDLLFLPEHIILEDIKDNLEEEIGVVLKQVLEDMSTGEYDNEAGNPNPEQPSS